MDYQDRNNEPAQRYRRENYGNASSRSRSNGQRSNTARRSASSSTRRRPSASSQVNGRAHTRTGQGRHSQQSRARSSNHNASYYGGSPQSRSKRPIILIAAAILIIIALVFLIRGCAGCDKGADQNNSQQPQGTQQAQTAASPLEAGRIVMTLDGDENTVVKQGETYIEAGCHALDKKEGNITSNVKTSGNVDTSKTGDYTITYTVRNSANMEATATRTVHVVDNMDVDTDGISVMMYHYIYTEDDKPDEQDTNYLLNTKFEEHLKWLTENNYYFPSYEELRAYIDGTHSLPKKSVVLTFDDAEDGFLKYGIPLLEKYKVPATSFIICGREESAAKLIDFASPYVTFQSHSWSLHEDGNTNIGRGGHIYDLNEDQLVEDCQKCIDMLGTNEAFAYPFGDVSDAAPAALKKAGYLCAFTIINGQVKAGDDPYRLVRMRVLAESPLEGYIYEVEHGL